MLAQSWDHLHHIPGCVERRTIKTVPQLHREQPHLPRSLSQRVPLPPPSVGSKSAAPLGWLAAGQAVTLSTTSGLFIAGILMAAPASSSDECSRGPGLWGAMRRIAGRAEPIPSGPVVDSATGFHNCPLQAPLTASPRPKECLAREAPAT